MNDVEIESLLEDAGYRFEPASGLYMTVEDKSAEGLGSEFVADELEIRWRPPALGEGTGGGRRRGEA